MTDKSDKNLLIKLFEAFSEQLVEQGKSREAVRSLYSPVQKFISYLNEREITLAKQITDSVFDEYQTWLYVERGVSYRSVAAYQRAIRQFFDYLVNIGRMRRNILSGRSVMKKPTVPVRQQSHYYTFEEIETRYLNHQKKWVSFNYLNQERKHVRAFIKYLRANEINSVYTVTEKTLLQFREYMWEEFVHSYKNSIVVRSQVERLRCIVRFFNYLEREGILKNNPTHKIDWSTYYAEIKTKAEKVSTQPQEDNDLTNIEQYMVDFLRYEEARGKSQSTVKHYRRSVNVFFQFMDENGISNLSQINKSLMMKYFLYLNQFVNARGQIASNALKNKLINSVKLFFKYLVRTDHLAKDPTVDLEPVREEQGLPRDFMNESEIIRLLDKPTSSTGYLAVRDKAVLEVLYSTGIRNNELCSLNIEDLDFQNGMIRINNPKGGISQQRIIPIGNTALNSIIDYLSQTRPSIENGDPRALFLSYRGHRLQNEAILSIVKKYVHECGFRKNITPHSFRVTCATQMLKNRADIRYVQEQLGHKRITSTQVYTRLTPIDLKSVHSKCHPREHN